MYFIQPTPFARALYGAKVTWSVPDAGRRLYLTFDDGPVPGATLPVLDILEEYRVKATFFCVGDNVFKHYPVYREILDRGHLTGNHTFRHLNGWKTDSGTYLDDVSRCRQLVESTLFRPPYGRIRRSQISPLSRDYTIVLWSVLAGDFIQGIRPEKCLQSLTRNLKGGNIYVFHDNMKTRKVTTEVLPAFIATALQQGFLFDTLHPAKENAGRKEIPVFHDQDQT